MEIVSKCSGCGMKLRGDDPTSMKDFVLGIQHRVNEIKTSTTETQDEKSKINSKRVRWLWFLSLPHLTGLNCVSHDSFLTFYTDGVYAWYDMWYQKQQKEDQRGSSTSHSAKKVAAKGKV